MTPETGLVHTGLGQHFYLSCHVSANPHADLFWTSPSSPNRHIKRQVQSRFEQVKRGAKWYLFVNNVTNEDFGEYVCHANNSVGTSKNNIVVVGM